MCVKCHKLICEECAVKINNKYYCKECISEMYSNKENEIYNKNEVIQIGTGMMARGEVALIIANKGLKMGVMNMYFLPAIIIMVVICAITTPIILKKAYSHKTIKEKV